METKENNQRSFDEKLFKFSLGTLNDQNIIWIEFPNNLELRNYLKSHAKVYWNTAQKCWYSVDNNHYRQLFRLPPKGIGKEAMKKIHEVNIPAFQRFKEQLILKGYSQSTVRTYTLEFAQLLYVLRSFPVENLSSEQLRSYCFWCINELKLSENQMHSRINALKFYYERILGREKFFVAIPRPKKALALPKVLSTREVKRLFEVTVNSKHRLMLQLCYGMGLRVSEIVNLKVADIDSSRMQVLIADAKGKKDRYVNLPASILESLRTYYKNYLPKDYLFEGQYGEAYSVRSVQLVFKGAMKRAKVRKKIGIHGLRHSYATHLLEYGTDITLIQKLLGHNNIKTTMIYTHVTNKNILSVESPLDRISDK